MRENKWLVNFRPNSEARMRLFCFPYAGGNPTMFRSWADALAPDIEVIAVQLPGHGTRVTEPLYTRTAPLINTLLANVEAFGEAPFALFGHSLGALLAYELAVKLSKQSLLSKKLIVSGSLPPTRSSGKGIHMLNDTHFIEKLRGLKGTPEGVLSNKELLDIILPILRADFAMAETYSREKIAQVPCPVTALSGSEDIKNVQKDMEDWASFTSADLDSVTFPGDHFFIQTSEAQVINQVKSSLLAIS